MFSDQLQNNINACRDVNRNQDSIDREREIEKCLYLEKNWKSHSSALITHHEEKDN